MFQWLLGLGGPRPKHLHAVLESLLALPPGAGEAPFILAEREVKRLCLPAREQLLKDASLVELGTAASVVVVGDLHGQFQDMQRIFARLGRPGSDGKVWVFLGDYVDRGPMGLEIVATLLVLKLLYPAQVYLLRGNHECSEITVLFGFCGECQRRSTLAVWEVIMQVFDALPLAALLNGKVFFCHGGISPSLNSPADINAIRRPLDVSASGEGLVLDLLWADPANISGWCPNPRGVSYVFGLDVAQAWMQAQGVRAIVRAHMMQQAGFEVLGNNEVMTVFSASDYRESGNTGAVLVIAASLDFEFVTFPPLRPPASRDDSLQLPGGMAADGGGEAPPHLDRDLSSGSLPPVSLAAGGLGVYMGAPAVHPSPFAAPAAAAAAEGQAGPGGADQVGKQEVSEEQGVIGKVHADPGLAALVRRPSENLPELAKLTGGARSPAEALARTASDAAAALGAGGPGPPSLA